MRSLTVEEMAAMYVSGMSLSEIAESATVSTSTVRLWLLKHGLTLRNTSAGLKSSSRWRAYGDRIKGVRKGPMPQESREKVSKARLAWADKNAKGISLKPNGYLEYTRGRHKSRPVHAVLMEEKIGRRLAPNELVHHEDEVKTNNEYSNLKLMTRSEHARLHRLREAERERIKNGK